MSKLTGIEIVLGATYRGKDGIDRKVTSIMCGSAQWHTIVFYEKIDSKFSGHINMVNFRYFYARGRIHG